MSNMKVETIKTASAFRAVDNVESVTLAVAAEETLPEALIIARNSATGNAGFYARGGSDGLNEARFVLMSETVVTAEDVVAGTKSIRVMTAGEVRDDMIVTKAGDTIDYRETDGLNGNNIICSSNHKISIPDL